MSLLDDVLEDSFFDAYNLGRRSGALLEEIELGVWSAILDGAACDFCKWANNKTFRLSEQQMNPPAHFGCRCVIVYYTPDMVEEGEEEFDSWDDIPTSVYPLGSKKG